MKIMKILPAKSEGCWIYFLSFFVMWFCIFLWFLFGAVIWFVILLSFCVIFLFFLSFSHPAQVAGPGADLESQHTSLVVFSSGAGAWIWSLAGKSKNVTLPAHDHFVCIVCTFFAFPKLEVFFCIALAFHFPGWETFFDFLHFPNQNDKERTKKWH